MNSTLLNLVLFFPLVGAVITAFLPRDQHALIKTVAVAVAGLNLFFSLLLPLYFNWGDNAAFQFVTAVPWVAQFGLQYKVGVDGIGLFLVLLTTFLSLIAVWSAFGTSGDRVKEFFVFLLLQEFALIGVFVALDLILFYAFWEAMLIPMYFLIGVWGGPQRSAATIKFVLYTLVGSLLMLVAIVWVYIASTQGGSGTFDLEILAGPNSPVTQSTSLAPWVRPMLFFFFASAFAIKVPLFPFHTWQADAYAEAPTPALILLAGVMAKTAVYGFLRFCIPLFPDVAVQYAPVLLGLAVAGIIYGALVAYTQTDMTRLLAFSSVSHLGVCVLGAFAFTHEAAIGTVLQLFNHGLSSAALFLVVAMLAERRGTREIAAFGGVWKVMPVLGAFFMIAMLSSVGLPLLNGFVGEFLIFLGAWRYFTWASVLGTTSVILGAIYLLWMFQRVMQGPLDNPQNRALRDLNWREAGMLLVLVLPMFWLGVSPSSATHLFDAAVHARVVQPVQVELERRAPRRADAAALGGIPEEPLAAASGAGNHR